MHQYLSWTGPRRWRNHRRSRTIERMKSSPSCIAGRTRALTWPLAGMLLLAGCASMESASRHADAAPTAAAEAVPLQAVTSGLFASGQPAPSQWASIRASGLTTVINLRPDGEMGGRDEASEVASAGMAYRQLDISGVQDITDANAAQVQAWIDEAPGPVLLHCASGNRAGALLAMIAARNGAPPEEALELGRRAGMTSLEEPMRAMLDLKTADTP